VRLRLTRIALKNYAELKNSLDKEYWVLWRKPILEVLAKLKDTYCVGNYA
jgi:hypothetical protein